MMTDVELERILLEARLAAICQKVRGIREMDTSTKLKQEYCKEFIVYRAEKLLECVKEIEALNGHAYPCFDKGDMERRDSYLKRKDALVVKLSGMLK